MEKLRTTASWGYTVGLGATAAGFALTAFSLHGNFMLYGVTTGMMIMTLGIGTWLGAAGVAATAATANAIAKAKVE